MADLHPHQQSVSVEDDPELMKTAKYYEQLVLDDHDTYKIGDHVYVLNAGNQLVAGSLLSGTHGGSLIVRVDRLWSIQVDQARQYYVRGPLFLRATDIEHEPTRLFYANEVFREQSREITVSLEQQVVRGPQGKCAVLSAKKYATSRVTHVAESDVYVCEAKYSLHTRLFRKFTKGGMRKFELSVKCMEDEVVFLRRELQLSKHLSPILLHMNIVYEEEEDDELLMDGNNLDTGKRSSFLWQLLAFKSFRQKIS